MTGTLDEKIKQRTFVAATPERVFDTITSAGEWNQFFTTGMTLEPRTGGDCTFRWKDWGPDFYTLEVPGRITELRRPEVFAFNWGSAGRQSTVRFELKAEYGGTVITLTEEGHRDDPSGRAMILECASGWGEAITLLKFYMEHGIVYTPPARPRG